MSSAEDDHHGSPASSPARVDRQVARGRGLSDESLGSPTTGTEAADDRGRAEGDSDEQTHADCGSRSKHPAGNHDRDKGRGPATPPLNATAGSMPSAGKEDLPRSAAADDAGDTEGAPSPPGPRGGL